METARDMLGGKPQELITVPVGTTVFDTLKAMNTHRVGAILITRNNQVVGIWTERDLMHDAATEGFDLKCVPNRGRLRILTICILYGNPPDST